jgi:hypothetical protein
MQQHQCMHSLLCLHCCVACWCISDRVWGCLGNQAAALAAEFAAPEALQRTMLPISTTAT